MNLSQATWYDALPLDHVGWHQPDAVAPDDQQTEVRPQPDRQATSDAAVAAEAAKQPALRQIDPQLTRMIACILAGGVGLGTLAYAEHSSGSRLPVVAAVIVGLALGWIAGDIEKALRRSRHRYR